MITFFSYAELTKTDTGLPNDPRDIRIIENLIETARYLDMIRKDINLPITVNSCYRSPEVNAKVGGSKHSWHCLALAADIKCKDMTKLAQYLDARTDLDEYGKYYDQTGKLRYVHIGLGPQKRKKMFTKIIR